MNTNKQKNYLETQKTSKQKIILQEGLVNMKIQEEIENLNKMLIKMADVVERNLLLAFALFHNYDEEIALQIDDDKVNDYERKIEEYSMNLMLKERFFAKDMRSVLGILTLVGDLERLGDHAEDINIFSKKLKNEKKYKIDDINKMIDLAIKMVHNSIESFIKKDISLAQQVIISDDLIDSLYDKLLDTIIKLKDDNQVSSSFAIYTTLVVKYIERIADHASNIAEWVIYILNGYYKDKQIF